jgi:hypothetical protein
MKNSMSWLLALIGLCWSARAAVLPPQKLLPKDTLFVFTVPEGANAWTAVTNTPMARLWFDPAMKPFRDKFDDKLTNEFLASLDRSFGVKLADYKELIQGQITFAILPVNQPDKPDQPFARVLLLDAKDHADQLKKNLAAIKKKWTEADKPMKTQKIREIDFTTFITTSDELPVPDLVPNPKNPLAPDDPAAPQAKPAAQKIELTVGQDDALLFVSDSTQAIEKILGRQEGASIPALEDLPAFQKDFAARLQGARIYAWANAKGALDYWLRKPAGGNAADAADAGGASLMLSSLGLGNLTSASFVYRDGPDGTTVQFFVGVPEDNRRGILKAMAFEAKDASPPAFVPADVVKCNRLRLDLPKSWAVLEALIGDLNPMAGRTINWILQTAGKDKDENYDLKAQLLSNLGNDVIFYQRSPRDNTVASLKSPPSVYLIGSPNAEKLAVAVKVAMGALIQGTSNIKDREFLGRKIYSVAMPGPQGSSSTFNFAASGDYVALSGDVDMLEEYLRSGENRHKSLAETAGLADAAQKVGGTATGLFGYGNEKENMRAVVEAYRKGPVTLPDVITSPMLLGKPGPDDAKKLKDWADFSLLPPYDMISKYFYFSVYAGSFSPDGFSLTFFTPTPPQLR